MNARRQRGKTNYHKGIMAENQVADAYRRSGFDVIDTRYKTPDGEIDVVARHGDKLYFVEVKSSRTHASACQMITPRQQKRIHDAALHYIADKAKTMDVDCRFDAALIDAQGRLKVLPGAIYFD
ncbi:MAG: YraN family protein [Pseudomonadota bacterium]